MAHRRDRQARLAIGGVEPVRYVGVVASPLAKKFDRLDAAHPKGVGRYTTAGGIVIRTKPVAAPPIERHMIIMLSRQSMFPLMAALAAVVLVPGEALAQGRGTPAQRTDNAKEAAGLQTMIADVDARVGEALTSRVITRSRAAQLRRQLAQTRRSMASLSRRQGFVSAAESASYTRTLDRITAELDRRGAPRSYGNDMLPSAEMTAFQQTDARLRYRDARIEYDARNCAVYQGTARDGRVRREPLLAAGKPICVRR